MLSDWKRFWKRQALFFNLIGWFGVVLGLFPGIAVGLLLGFLVAAQAALLWGIGITVGTAVMLWLFARPGELPEDMELRVVLRKLEKGGEYDLPELAGQTGLKARFFEHKLLELIGLEVLTLAYYPPEQRIYIPEEGRDLHHCPRCAADFATKSSGRCPNCKVRFSRVVLERPYQYG